MNGLFDTPREFTEEFAKKWDEHNGVIDFDKLFENPENVRRALATKAIQDAIRQPSMSSLLSTLARSSPDLEQFRPMMSTASIANTLPRLPLLENPYSVGFPDSLIGALFGLAYGSAVGMPFSLWQNEIPYRDIKMRQKTSDIPPFPAQRTTGGKTQNLTPGLPGYPFEHCLLVYTAIIGMRNYSRDVIIGNYIDWVNGLEGAWMKTDAFMKLFKNIRIDQFSGNMNWYLRMDSTRPDNGEYLCRILPLCYCEAALIDDITLTNPCDIAIEVGKLFAELYQKLLASTPIEDIIANMSQRSYSPDVMKVFADLDTVKSMDSDANAFSKRRVPESDMNTAVQCLYIVLAALKRFSIDKTKPERMLMAIEWAIFESNGSTKSNLPATPGQLVGGLVGSVCGCILGFSGMKSCDTINVNLERLHAAARIDNDPNYLTSLIPRPNIGNTPRREMSILNIVQIVEAYMANCPGMTALPYSRTIFKPTQQQQQKVETFVPSTTVGYSGPINQPIPQVGMIPQANMGQIAPTWVMDRPASSHSGIRQL